MVDVFRSCSKIGNCKNLTKNGECISKEKCEYETNEVLDL